MKSLMDKLKKFELRFNELELLILDFEYNKKNTDLIKEYNHLNKVISLYNDYKKILNDINNTKDILNNNEDILFKNIAKEDILNLSSKKKDIEKKIKMMVVFQDPNDDKNIILEIRSGSGGDEASVFSKDLFRMYRRFFEKKKWNLEIIDLTENFSGYKEIICKISGNFVYRTMKHESGVHRVQRVPSTESKGRIHTSAVSVVILPEISDIKISINMNEIRKDTFCSSGPGGQSVNTTYSAIRLTHIPTGLVVSCQDEKSQIKNFNKALRVLKGRLYRMKIKEQQRVIGLERKLIVKKGDRSDKIRTYNYPKRKVIDHRNGYVSYDLFNIMNGNLEGILNSFIE